MEISDLRGVGPKREQVLRAMGINSLRDLLYLQPVSYQDRTTFFPCSTKQQGQIMIHGFITNGPKINHYNGLTRVSCTIEDKTGKMPAVWYNQPWVMQQLHNGEEADIYGILTIKNNRRVLNSPQIVHEKGFIPIYRMIKGFPSGKIRELIREALNHIDECCTETIPYRIRMEYHLCELNFALRQVHFPESYESLKTARRRLSFESLLLYQATIHKFSSETKKANSFSFSDDLTDKYWQILPYKPTNSQYNVLNEIASDLRKEKQMSRLIQGDVGCGKTAVAFGAIFLAALSGYQSVMMAPTEILARQHYESAREIFKKENINCRLLTGSTPAAERRKTLDELSCGKCDAVFGTHALISEKVTYRKLGLAITDEQHRFGVKQRTILGSKGTDSGLFPHVLVMSATPIPRTMALIIYGDLDISVINELPPGRKYVKTRLVPEEKRESLYNYLKETVKKGKQAYIVCPLVRKDEETDYNGIHNVIDLYSELKKGILKDINIGLTWGEQPSAEKEKVLKNFSAGKISVLVSTTVIEVGINVPNATVMIIENAERFGLSQLHQLRGRVGRGKDESWCFMIAERNDKLDVMCRTNDGFEIANKDLELRGPGDILGVRQSGDPLIAIGGNYDIRLLEETTDCMKKLYNDDKNKEDLALINGIASERFKSRYDMIAFN